MTRTFSQCTLVVLSMLFACKEEEIDTATPPAQYTELVWSEDFTTPLLDKTKWNINNGTYFDANGELQTFTDRPENVSIKDGNLVIEARKEAFADRNYTSGDLSTKGKFNFQDNCRIDFRVKMSLGQGLWNSIAFLPEEQKYGPYPQSGAITLEHLARNPKELIVNVAYASSGAKALKTQVFRLDKETFSDGFHLLSVIWGSGIVRCYYDGTEIIRVKENDFGGAAYPFNEKFFLSIKTIIGGQIAGDAENTPFPQQLLVDYIKVYRVPNG